MTSDEALRTLTEQFVGADTWAASQEIVEAHPELLSLSFNHGGCTEAPWLTLLSFGGLAWGSHRVILGVANP